MAHDSKISRGYNRISILAHWLTALSIVALFLTHEGSQWQLTFHVSVGALLGIFLIWRVFRRLFLGFPEKTDQLAALNLLSSIVVWAFLINILVVTVSGYLLPWSRGASLEVFGIIIPSPIPGSHDFHEIIEEVHDISGHIFVPIIVLHILGALKHMLLDRDDVMQRMFKAAEGGK